MLSRLYLDCAATTPVSPAVREAMLRCLERPSPSSATEARARVAARLGVTSERLVITAGGTAANNQALRSVAAAQGSGHIIAQPTEHPSVLRPLEDLAARGFEVELLPVDAGGRVDPDRLSAAIRPDTILVSLMLANHETGVVLPTAALGAVCQERGVLFHVDAVQGMRHLRPTLPALRCDLLALSGHKLDGPKGIGALAFSEQAAATLSPDSAAIPAASVVGLDVALEERWAATDAAALAASRDRLQAALLAAIPGLVVNGGGERLPSHLNLSVSDVSGEALVLDLDEAGIAVSSGSACASGSAAPSPVLLAMGRSRAEANGSLRFSLSSPLSSEAVARVAEALRKAAGRLRAIAPRP